MFNNFGTSFGPRGGSHARFYLPPPRQMFSQRSSPAVENSLFFAEDFMLGAGMVILQPSTGKVVLLWNSHNQSWFLPKGRKDKGESLEQTALREAYEESGYRAEFLPLCAPSNAPTPGPDLISRIQDTPHIEPIFINITSWRERQSRRTGRNGGEYFTLWYVGQIPADAVHEENTGMADEKHYVSHILSYEEAMENLRLAGDDWDANVLQGAYDLWRVTEETLAQARSEGPSATTR